ncbi:glycoside hydrolase family 75 protein [Umezawaea sp. Da 62-37]|uniref:glycoside hydrolase family 75 protein n=1 Tax=Umezawaea sp. Da 62-37 TaxID=3075927 RepID=UPI0028F6E434|nr:glycoside hydrolase family 75 protein [Umezawaea sp. Da 62-37]WNV88786.1 glycoside hydrolase family 75 protein [Umezawaea sp. Da 62-37]
MRRPSRFGAGLLVLGAIIASTLTSTGAQADVRAAAAQDVSAQAGPTAAALLAKLTSCSQISTGKYRSDEETSANIPVCGKTGAVWYKADLDVDCDGKVTAKCNEDTDPWFQDDTAFHDSKGAPLQADKLPYVVVPSPSGTWDYRKFGISGGGIVAVIYNNKVEYAVVGDTGPTAIIGEASYATAVDLGINPDPENGGSDGPVHYIYFKNSKVSPIEDHAKATSQGAALAQTFIDQN